MSAGMLMVRDERDLDHAFLSGSLTFPCAEDERVVIGVRSLHDREVDALKDGWRSQRYGADGIGALYDKPVRPYVQLHG